MMMSEVPSFSETKKAPEVSEISISDIVLFIKKYFIKILIVGIVFGIAGYAISFFSRKIYTSQTQLLPEQASGSGSGLSALAGLTGLNGASLAERVGAVRTDLYPNVLTSVPFALHILSQPVFDQNNVSYNSLEKFLNRDSSSKQRFWGFFSTQKKKPLPKLKIDLSKSNILNLSPEKDLKVKSVLQLINAEIDTKTGIITIKSEMQDPVVAAMTAAAAADYLMHYVEDYRTGKTAREVAFLGQRVIEAKKREQKAEYALQIYRDRNRNAYLNVARIEEQRLQTEFTLAQSLYADLIRKWEQAKVKVKEEQPIFKVLEPAKIPLQSSSPRRLISAGIFTFLGFIAAFTYIFYKEKWYKKMS